MSRFIPPEDPKAVVRVTNVLPAPHECPHCGSAVRVANNAEVYGEAYGQWPWMYLCENRKCRAYVGMHPRTHIPLGTLATSPIRNARKRAKALFNPLWQSKAMSRTQAYAWLAKGLGVPVEECHFGWFDKAQCEQAIALLLARPGS